MGNIKNQDIVWCFDAVTGAVVWKYSYDCPVSKEYPGPRCTPAVSGNLVFTVSYEGELNAIDAAKGTVVWHKNYQKDFGGKVPFYGFTGSPLVDGKLVIVNAGGKGASVVALEASSGAVIWKSGDDIAGYSTPLPFVIGTQRVIAVFSGTGLHVFNLSDGKELWKSDWKSPANVNATDPLIQGDSIFISSGAGCSLLKYTADNATPVYTNKNFFAHSTCPVLIDGTIYGFSGMVGKGPLTCIDFATGTAKWKNQTIKGTLAAVDKKLLILTTDGNLLLAEASPEGCKELNRAPAMIKGECHSAPVLANGRVYCRNLEGEAVCMDFGGK